MKNILFLILSVILLVSCNDRRIHYKQNRTLYINSIKCLNSKYDQIFKNNGLNQGISIYLKDVKEYGLCEDIIQLFTKEEIDFIDYQKDSTIGFYFKELKGLPSRQPVLMYFDKEDIHSKIGTDYKVIKINDAHWFELERYIGIAN